MAMKEGTVIAIIAIAAILFLANQGAKTPVVPPAIGDANNDANSGGGVDLCKLVDGQVSFTGQNKFLSGTALATDYVRVLEINGDNKKRDLGRTSMDSGTLAVAPTHKYKLYFGENNTGTTRYNSVEDYTAPCQKGTDNKVGYLCTVDTAPTITVFDENGQVQSGTTNAQAMEASDIINVEVKVKATADSCYGNPQAPSKNAICFDYNGTVFDSVKANTVSSAIPYSVSSNANKPAGYSQSCYELNLLADTASQLLTVTLDASATAPTSKTAINVSLEDVDLDLNQDSLEEIWGFSDESNNNLGAARVVHTNGIQVS